MQLSRHSPLGVQGACSLFPIRCSFGYLACGRRLSWEKTLCKFEEKTLVNMVSFELCLTLFILFLIITWIINLTLMCLFCSGFNHWLYFVTVFSHSWHLSTVALSAYFVRNAQMLIPWISDHSVKVHLIFRHISLKFQGLFTWVSDIFI